MQKIQSQVGEGCPMHAQPSHWPGGGAGLQEAGSKMGRSSQVNGTTASWEEPQSAVSGLGLSS